MPRPSLAQRADKLRRSFVHEQNRADGVGTRHESPTGPPSGAVGWLEAAALARIVTELAAQVEALTQRLKALTPEEARNGG